MIILILTILLCLNVSIYAQNKNKIDTNKQFTLFLEDLLAHDIVNNKTRDLFYSRSWSFWNNNMLDYNRNPKKYKKNIALFFIKIKNVLNKIIQ